MRIAFISKYNNGYLQQLNNNKISFKSFNEGYYFQKNDFFYHYGTLAHYIEENGHDAMLIVPNYEHLQGLWCKENNINQHTTGSLDIVKKQLGKFDPDIVFLNSNFEYYSEIIPFSKNKGFKVVAWISCPMPKEIDIKNLDHIFTLFKPHHQLFLDLGIPSTLTHSGFDERIIESLDNKKIYPVTFIGGIGGFHTKRELFLRKIIKKIPLSIWGYGFKSQEKWKSILKQIKQRFTFNKAYKGEVWAKSMYQVLNASQITINAHGDIAEGHSVNMRLFEATGSGTLLLTEENDQIKELFEPGKEVIVYNSPEDAIKKITYYLSHSKEAELIAKAGQLKTLENYNYKSITKDYISVFEKLLANEK
ncbi:MAG: glycosyltransferase [Crocinitomicaceae bacterium]